MALHPLCKPWLGTARLTWDEPTNRPFLKALSRHMHNVARRGCPRTALELGRLLLSLSPERDPLHACLHLDHFALCAAAAAPADASWVLRLPRAYPAHGLLLYPNYALSAAAALRVLGRTEAAATQLRCAPPPPQPHPNRASPPHTFMDMDMDRTWTWSPSLCLYHGPTVPSPWISRVPVLTAQLLLYPHYPLLTTH